MNYWPRWISAIRKRTMHLSLAQMGAYDRLLDHYYAEEKPLPGTLEACCRIAGAMTKAEREAVKEMLAQFFVLKADGYHNERADEEISIAIRKIGAARENGKKGGRPHTAGDYMPSPGWIYAIRIDTGRVKVGASSNLKSRLYQHRRTYGPQIAIIHTVRVGHMGDAEWDLLSTFEDSREGELLPVTKDREGTLIDEMNRIAVAFPEESRSHTQSHTQSESSPSPSPEESTVDVLSPSLGGDGSAGIDGHSPTEAGLVCRALRQAGVAATNPSNQLLRTLLDAGATTEEFLAAAAKATDKSRPFEYLLTVVQNDRQRAKAVVSTLHHGAMPTRAATAAEQRVLDAVPGVAARHLRPVATQPLEEVFDVSAKLLDR